jgi:hypothetical protein
MKRITFVALFVFVISLCTAATQAQTKFSKVVTDAKRWDPIEYKAPAECTSTPEECAVKMLDELKISVGDEPDFSVYRVGEVNEKSVTVVFVSHLVDEDDSVLGMLYRLEMSLSDVEDNSFSLDGLGQMFQCMNGPSGWRKTLCP